MSTVQCRNGRQLIGVDCLHLARLTQGGRLPSSNTTIPLPMTRTPHLRDEFVCKHLSIHDLPHGKACFYHTVKDVRKEAREFRLVLFSVHCFEIELTAHYHALTFSHHDLMSERMPSYSMLFISHANQNMVPFPALSSYTFSFVVQPTSQKMFTCISVLAYKRRRSPPFPCVYRRPTPEYKRKSLQKVTQNSALKHHQLL